MTYTCTRDADTWQLYSCMEGVEEAAANLSTTLTKLVRAGLAKLKADPDLSETKLAWKVRDKMDEALDGAADFGACDTEPRGVLLHEIEKAFRLDPYTLD